MTAVTEEKLAEVIIALARAQADLIRAVGTACKVDRFEAHLSMSHRPNPRDDSLQAALSQILWQPLIAPNEKGSMAKSRLIDTLQRTS